MYLILSTLRKRNAQKQREISPMNEKTQGMRNKQTERKPK